MVDSIFCYLAQQCMCSPSRIRDRIANCLLPHYLKSLNCFQFQLFIFYLNTFADKTSTTNNQKVEPEKIAHTIAFGVLIML